MKGRKRGAYGSGLTGRQGKPRPRGGMKDGENQGGKPFYRRGMPRVSDSGDVREPCGQPGAGKGDRPRREGERRRLYQDTDLHAGYADNRLQQPVFSGGEWHMGGGESLQTLREGIHALGMAGGSKGGGREGGNRLPLHPFRQDLRGLPGGAGTAVL